MPDTSQINSELNGTMQNIQLCTEITMQDSLQTPSWAS